MMASPSDNITIFVPCKRDKAKDKYNLLVSKPKLTSDDPKVDGYGIYFSF